MQRDIAEKVLFIGVDYHNAIGGIAAVENEYAKFVKPFKFVRTCVTAGKVRKAAVAAEGLVHFTWKMLTDKQIQIVHINAASDASFWRKRIFVNIARRFGKKIVYHNHGGGFKRFAAEHPEAVKGVLSKVDTVVALSQNWVDYFRNEQHCPSVTVINNVVSHPPRPVAAPQPRDPATPLRLTFLGKIMDAKGIFDLVELLSTHRDEYEGRVVLTVGGNGEVERFKQLIASRNLGGMVHYAGWVDAEAKDRLLASTDVYILPSYFEGLPISILEAMSYGKPIISTPVGGIPEIVADGTPPTSPTFTPPTMSDPSDWSDPSDSSDGATPPTSPNGFLVAPGDLPGLKAAIDRFLVDPSLLATMGTASLARVQPFYPESVAASLTTLYRSLLLTP